MGEVMNRTELIDIFINFDGDRNTDFINAFPGIWEDCYDISEDSRYSRVMVKAMLAGYDTQTERVELLQSEINNLNKFVAEKDAEIESLQRALALAERRNGDTVDLMDASQEAQHYDWLDQQNAKLKSDLDEAVEVIKFYGDVNQMNHGISMVDYRTSYINEDDFDDVRLDFNGAVTKDEGNDFHCYGKRARQFLAKINEVRNG